MFLPEISTVVPMRRVPWLALWPAASQPGVDLQGLDMKVQLQLKAKLKPAPLLSGCVPEAGWPQKVQMLKTKFNVRNGSCLWSGQTLR